MYRRAWTIFLLLALGCPGESDQRAITDVCTKTGTQCRIGEGKLGVCMMRTDGTFECASQH